jgi:pantothenate kinase type III
MHEKTAQLPLLQNHDVLNFANSIGKTTHEAMAGGVYWGMIHEVMGAYEAYKGVYNSPILILTGGDLSGLAFPEKKFIFAHPNFTSIGLNTILLYNQNSNLEF